MYRYVWGRSTKHGPKFTLLRLRITLHVDRRDLRTSTRMPTGNGTDFSTLGIGSSFMGFHVPSKTPLDLVRNLFSLLGDCVPARTHEHPSSSRAASLLSSSRPDMQTLVYYARQPS